MADKTCTSNTGQPFRLSAPMGPKSPVDPAMATVDQEIVEGESAISAKLRELNVATELEVNTFAPGGAHTPEQIADTQKRNADMYAKGIRSRTIYLDSVRNDKATLGHVRWLNERGSEVRTIPTLPIRMIIADKKTVVLPHNPGNAMLGIVIHRSPSVVTPLQALLEMTWEAATPLGLTLSPNDTGPTMEERAVLEQLALGRTDKEIALVMGTSERTIGRKIAAIMKRLNAETRFEAAYQAAKKRWI